jgi:corrinoid protein of di/trimethylamine methyltransferase
MYISQSHLSRLFKRFTGETFTEYLKNVRLTHACSLLRETDLTVDEIAKQCGLRDLPSFYRAFNSYKGMTPNQYRNKKQTQNKNLSEREKLIMSILNEISANLQIGKAKIVKELVQRALDEGVEVEKILNEGLLAGMSIVGEKFKNNEVYVPEVLVAARAMNMGTQILKPHLAANGIVAKGRVCIGTVQGDLHDIGKNLVKMMLEGKGLEVIDLGTDVAPETFVNTAIEQNCQVICCSALLTTTMGVMEEVVKLAEAKGIRNTVKIMVGGAPVNEDYAKKIDADVYTSDAASAADAAVKICEELLA